jgi:hypothetical protein
VTSTAKTRRPASAGGGITSSANTRRIAGASGITSCGVSGSGRRGIVVNTGIVICRSNSEFGITTGPNSCGVVPDEDDTGPSDNIDSPTEASTSLSGSRK